MFQRLSPYVVSSFSVCCYSRYVLVGSLKMNTALEYSTRVVQEGDRRCKKSTLNDLAYLTPLRIPLMNPVYVSLWLQPYYAMLQTLDGTFRLVWYKFRPLKIF
jgi:hypothetical protein